MKMMSSLLIPSILYLSLFAGLIAIRITKLYQSALSLLVFSSIFVAGVEYNDGFIAAISGLMISALSAYLFNMQYEHSPSKSGDEKSVSDVIIGYFLAVFIVILFKYHGASWCFSLLMGYWVFYVIVIVLYWESRKSLLPLQDSLDCSCFVRVGGRA